MVYLDQSKTNTKGLLFKNQYQSRVNLDDIENCKIMLWTGLTDSNGNNIWENDIVEFKNPDCKNNEVNSKYIKGKVIYQVAAGGFQIEVIDKNSNISFLYPLFHVVNNGAVIGYSINFGELNHKLAEVQY